MPQLTLANRCPVNTAGIDPAGTVVDILWEQAENNRHQPDGPFLLMSSHSPQIKTRRLIIIASLPQYAVACHAGLFGLKVGTYRPVSATALDYGRDKIRVNVVCPGPIQTEMLEHSMAGLAETLNTDINGALNTLTRFIPLQRPATPDEVSGIVIFLASDESTFITGTVTMVDGGACIVDPCDPRSPVPE